MNEETAVATIPQTTPIAVNVQLTATQPDEIATAQASLIDWCNHKIVSLQVDRSELKAAHENAVKNKWAGGPLKRQLDKVQKRIEFYEKMLSALEHGYVIIPNFPVTVFAIRTTKEKPLKMMADYWGASHEQKTECLPEGEGQYQNPFPTVWQRKLNTPTQQEPNKITNEYWVDEWKELEFPLQMAKLNIMEATNRAMALKCFDDFGILPGKKKEDPIIVARLLDPRSTRYNRRFVTFMVAWHLNTRDL
jgi:hypothetical protein